MSLDELEPAANRLFRYAARSRDFELTHAGGSTREIVAHMERFYGPVHSVLHEIVSELVHVDVHLVEPSDLRPHWTLFTTGMSDAAMKVPKEYGDLSYAELVLKLPREWPLEEDDSLEDELWAWPVRCLQQLARLPHVNREWLGAGHMIPNGEPIEPFTRSTNMCALLVLPLVGVPDAARALSASGRRIQFYGLHALFADELELARAKGTGALLELFERHRVTDVLDPVRPSAVRRPRIQLG